jgi:hypothetical protein
VRGEHEADDAFAVLQRADAVLDEGRGVLHPERDGISRPELVLQDGCLRLGALAQRRDPADGVVPAAQVVELLGCRRSPAADVGVVRLDVVGGGR